MSVNQIMERLMPVNQIISTLYDNGAIVEQHVVSAEDASTQTVEVRNGSNQPIAGRGYTKQRDIEGENRSTIEQQGRQAFQANRDYVALASPTTAQNTAQIKALSRQMNGVLRLIFQQFDGTN